MPRPPLDAVNRGDGRAPVRGGFDDDADERSFKPLTHAEAEAFRREHPPLSPWRVVAAQVMLGLVAAGVAWLLAGKVGAVSALYGAAVVAVPGALMARGATSRLSSLVAGDQRRQHAVVGVRESCALGRDARARRRSIVPGVVWPALLASMVLCMQSYWFALLWRNR